tara:strand:- start:116 stop:955 length:840 start_codon:yes stop_codon:yes gene_type:complete
MKVRLGVRGSELALSMAEIVTRKLEQLNCTVEIVPIKSDGDIHEDKVIADIGGKGVFCKRIEDELHNGAVDIAVHSTKDLPTVMPKELILAAVLKRNDPRDCYLGKFFPGARVGTGSPRRIAQLKNNFKVDFKIEHIRGNIATRIKKLNDGKYDAIILARAGLEILGLEKYITHTFDFDKMLPAVGQGVIAVQTRTMSPYTALVRQINHLDTFYSVLAERTALKFLDGDCHSAVGVLAQVVGDCITLKGINYENMKQSTVTGKILEYKQIGEQVGLAIK